MADIIQAQIIDEEIVTPSADPVAHNMPGGGAVESVNGKTGAVVLTAEDVGAVAAEAFNAAIEGKQDKLTAGTGAEIKDGVLSATTLGITGAAVGQIARITAVDSDGKPTAWEPVDMASGAKWELIYTGGVGDKGVSRYVIDYDMDGNPFSLSEFELIYTIYNPDGYSVALGGGMQINKLNKSYFNVNGVSSTTDCYMGCIGSDPVVVATKGIHNLFIYKGRIVDGFLIMEGFSTGYGYDENDNIASIYGTQGMFSTGKWNDMRSKGAIFQNGVTSFLFQYSYDSFKNANITLRGVRT